MAAKAHDQAAHVGGGGRDAGRQGFREAGRSIGAAGDDGLAVEAAEILAPESDGAGGVIGGFGLTVAIYAAVRCVAGRATTAIVEVSAENVGRWVLNLRGREGRGCNKHHGD